MSFQTDYIPKSLHCLASQALEKVHVLECPEMLAARGWVEETLEMIGSSLCLVHHSEVHPVYLGCAGTNRSRWSGLWTDSSHTGFLSSSERLKWHFCIVKLMAWGHVITYWFECHYKRVECFFRHSLFSLSNSSTGFKNSFFL